VIVHLALTLDADTSSAGRNNALAIAITQELKLVFLAASWSSGHTISVFGLADTGFAPGRMGNRLERARWALRGAGQEMLT